MQPSIWTSMYHQLTPSQALRKLNSQGWEVFELSCEHVGVLGHGGAEIIAEYAATIADLGVQVPQCHCTITVDVASPDPHRRQADLALVHRDIGICAEIGVRNIVIHPGGYAEYPTREAVREVDDLRRAAFEELAGHCERVGTRLALENVADHGKGVWGQRRFGAIVEELLGLIDEINSPALGVCLDTSHANMMGLSQPEAIRTCGPRLYALHISDNDGSGDLHRTPGYGNVAWPPIVQALREIGYPFHFNLEIPGELRMEDPAPEVVDLRSAYALGVCRYLLGG